jgi:hypothetical protein
VYDAVAVLLGSPDADDADREIRDKYRGNDQRFNP